MEHHSSTPALLGHVVLSDPVRASHATHHHTASKPARLVQATPTQLAPGTRALIPAPHHKGGTYNTSSTEAIISQLRTELAIVQISATMATQHASRAQSMLEHLTRSVTK